jgi:hypothetical protein
MADAGRERVVHRAVAQGALRADRAQAAVRFEKSGQADDCVELEQSQCDGRIVQIDAALAQIFDQCTGERIDVHFQPDRQRRFRAYTGAHTAESLALDRLVQLDGVAPEGLVSERIEAKNLPAFGHSPLGMLTDIPIEPRGVRPIVVIIVVRPGNCIAGKRQAYQQSTCCNVSSIAGHGEVPFRG